MQVRKLSGSWVTFLFVACTLAFAADEAKIETGTVRGVTQDGVVAFKGIPFAAPPVGNLRWRPPQAAVPWTGVRPATDYGHDCMQLPFAGDSAPLRTTPDEDCLFINVWAPAGSVAAKLPVIVWIYGGGWVNGGSSPAVYEGTQFAKEGLVFVSFNYRLGRLGYFGHPALSAESPSDPLGNYGTMDQVAALKWVQRNIATFGGDPKQVTIFGESAGGGAVLHMLTSPMARDLFQRAIVESAPARDGFGGAPQLKGKSGFLSKATGESAGVAFAKSKGITGEDAAALAALRKLPADAIVDGLNMMTIFLQGKSYTGPMIDGQVIVETPQAALLAGHQMKVPVIVGATNRDMGFSFARTMQEVMAPFGFNGFRAIGAYDPQHTNDVKVVGAAVASDRFMVEPARFVARQVAAAGQTAYEYRFGYVAVAMRGEWDGAPHASEIPFVFDTVKAHYESKLDTSDSGMAASTHAYWVAFAKTGDPNAGGRPRMRWPAYTQQNDTLLEFTNTGLAGEADPWKTRLDLAEKIAGHP